MEKKYGIYKNTPQVLQEKAYASTTMVVKAKGFKTEKDALEALKEDRGLDFGEYVILPYYYKQ